MRTKQSIGVLASQARKFGDILRYGDEELPTICTPCVNEEPRALSGRTDPETGIGKGIPRR